MISKTLTNFEIETLIASLRGANNDGLAFQRFPVKRVIYPLLDFMEKVSPLLRAYVEARKALKAAYDRAKTDEEREAVNQEAAELMAEKHDIRVMPICKSCLDDMELSLSELQILSTFFPPQDEPDIAPEEAV